MSGEIIVCPFTTMECKYTECFMFAPNYDTCGFKIMMNALLKTPPKTRTPPKTTKQPSPLIPPSPVEEKIKQILAMKPNLNREAVERLIDEERAKAAGLLTEEAAAHLVASNLGLDRDPGAFPELKGQWLKEITGEVVGNLETREVDTNSGLTLITNFKLTDGKKTIRVGVWGELGDALRLKEGDTITLTNMKIGQPYEGTEQISSTRNTKIS